MVNNILIETNRYVLKTIENKNINNIFNILSNKNVVKNLNMNIHKKIEDTETLLKNYNDGLKEKTKFPFEIIDKTNNRFLGVFLLKVDLYDEDCFEFTIYLDEKYWGNGIYTEILPYMARYVFYEINVNNFRGFVKEKNEASKKVLEKCGFELEKIFSVEGIDDKIYSYLMTKEMFIMKYNYMYKEDYK